MTNRYYTNIIQRKKKKDIIQILYKINGDKLISTCNSKNEKTNAAQSRHVEKRKPKGWVGNLTKSSHGWRRGDQLGPGDPARPRGSRCKGQASSRSRSGRASERLTNLSRHAAPRALAFLRLTKRWWSARATRATQAVAHVRIGGKGN